MLLFLHLVLTNTKVIFPILQSLLSKSCKGDWQKKWLYYIKKCFVWRIETN